MSTNTHNIHFLHTAFQVSHISWCAQKFRSFHNSIVLVCVKVSTYSILKIFQNESKCKVNICSIFRFLGYIIQFIVKKRHVLGWPGKVDDSVYSILHLSISQKVFARFQFFSQTLIVHISHYILLNKIAFSESHVWSMLSVSVLM